MHLIARGSDLRLPSANRVYEALAEHQVSGTWELRELLAELHRWVGILVFEFKLEIPDVALCVDRLRFRRNGHFRGGRNGFGLKGEIAINRRHIHGKEFWEVLGTLLHELLHAWQQVQGQPGAGNYHNKQFRRRAAEFGLIVDERGEQQYQPNGPFMRLLQEHGVQVPKLPEPTASPVGCTKLKLWVCRCDPPFRVRVARTGFSATCNYCGQEYFQPDISPTRERGEFIPPESSPTRKRGAHVAAPSLARRATVLS